jgi:glutamine amidotransferase
MTDTGIKRIMIVDYGMGNLASVRNALDHLGGVETVISGNSEDIPKADAYILPGVGAFGQAMAHLHRENIVAPLQEEVLGNGKPFLGICLGMQLIAHGSEESEGVAGLGWVEGQVRKLQVGEKLRLPHIGWNNVTISKESPLFTGIEGDLNFYFVHSFALHCEQEYIAATCDYGTSFTASVQKDNIFAVQFHPEKSQSNGLRLYQNYIDYICRQPLGGRAVLPQQQAKSGC